MTDLARVQDFVDTSRQLSDVGQLKDLLRETRRELGFQFFRLLQRVEQPCACPSQGEIDEASSILLHDYPEDWVRAYVDGNLAALDPVILASAVADGSFRWADIHRIIELTPAQHKMFESGRQAGIADGYTIPAQVVGYGEGSCNFAIGADTEPSRTSLLLAELVGIHAFHAARLIVQRARGSTEAARLSPRQRDCVELVGRGKTDWEIAKILDLSPLTVKDYLDDARRKYGVSKRVQIVLRAVFDGQMALSSLVH